MVARVVTPDQLASYASSGFFRIEGFAPPDVGNRMLDRVIEIARRSAAGETFDSTFVLPEGQPNLAVKANPEDMVSKVFRLARDTVFHDFAVSPQVTDVVADLLGCDDIDNFLSQFIFKNKGAWGQPWHQDSFYFPFQPARPVVGVWLAVTEATLDNGCLHVLAGSHQEPVHDHVVDRRPGANYGYVEIVDHDMSASVPVPMNPGDLLVFDSHLMHRSTDNESDGLRAAMVYHYARSGTVDRTEELRGYTVNDWIPARRAEGGSSGAGHLDTD